MKRTRTVETRERVFIRTFRGEMCALTETTDDCAGTCFVEVGFQGLLCRLVGFGGLGSKEIDREWL